MTSNIVRHDFNGFSIPQRADGMVSLTAMVKAFPNKRMSDFLSSKSTIAYLEALSRLMGIPVSQLILVLKGNSRGFEQGTWAHPKVAAHFAKWLRSRDILLHQSFGYGVGILRPVKDS